MFTRQVTRGERGQGALASSLAEESLHSIGLVKVHGYEASEKKRFHKQLQVLAELSYLKMVGYAVGLLLPPNTIRMLRRRGRNLYLRIVVIPIY